MALFICLFSMFVSSYKTPKSYTDEKHKEYKINPNSVCDTFVFILWSGSGGYADNNVGATSTTGHGESIMKVVLARLVLYHMEQGNIWC